MTLRDFTEREEIILESLSPCLKELDEKTAELWIRYDAVLHTDTDFFVPSNENIANMLSRIRELRGQLQANTDAVGWDQLVGMHLEEMLAALEFRLIDEMATPHRYLSDIGYTIDRFLLLDGRGAVEKEHVLCERLHRLVAVLQAATRRARDVQPEQRSMLIEYIESLLAIMRTYRESDRFRSGQLHVLLGVVSDVLKQSLSEVAAMTGKGDRHPLPYRQRLKTLWGIDVEEMLDWSKEEYFRCRGRLTQLTEDLHGVSDVRRYVNKDDTPLGSPEEALNLMRKYLCRARNAAQRHVALPRGEECWVERVPAHMEPIYPWGGCISPSPLSKSLSGAVLINATNYRALSRGWLKMLALHECYPGHHAQRVRTSVSSLPRSFKVHTLAHPSSPLVEGMAHRSETVLADVFGPFFRVFAAYRRLHTITRVRADLALNYQRRPAQEAVQMYRDSLGLSSDVARGQVHFQRLLPGYMTIYYYGVRFLEELGARVPMDDRKMSEALFSAGYVSLRTFENMLIRSLGPGRTGAFNLREEAPRRGKNVDA